MTEQSELLALAEVEASKLSAMQRRALDVEIPPNDWFPAVRVCDGPGRIYNSLVDKGCFICRRDFRGRSEYLITGYGLTIRAILRARASQAGGQG